MIKNLFFDMGGVIFLQDTPEAFRRFRAAGIDTDFYMGEHGQKDFFLDLETGAIDADEFCRRMSEAVGRPVTGEEARLCWWGFIGGVPVERLRFILQLRRDYHVCLLSNTNPFIMSYMRSPQFSSDGYPISHYFDSQFCSYEMKAYKPDAEFFKFVLNRDGLVAEESLFVDDSLKNIRAAESLGIKGLHVEQNGDWTSALRIYLEQSGSGK